MTAVETLCAEACRIAHSLYARGKTSGSSANMSFRVEDHVYITAGGCCFETLRPEEFSCLSLQGDYLAGPKPSKEWPLHLSVYTARPQTGAVIHVHSTYSVLWSCVPGLAEEDCVPPNTPYLRMKVGQVNLVHYAKPGSQELFGAFAGQVSRADAWLLRRHGPVVQGETLAQAYYGLEELEESCRIAWELRNAGITLE